MRKGIKNALSHWPGRTTRAQELYRRYGSPMKSGETPLLTASFTLSASVLPRHKPPSARTCVVYSNSSLFVNLFRVHFLEIGFLFAHGLSKLVHGGFMIARFTFCG